MHLVYEMTTHCNNSCSYCYNVWNYNKYPKWELNFVQIKKLFHKLFSENKIGGITLAGGEPLLHPDFFQTLKYLKSKTDNLNIATNGILLDQKAIKIISSIWVNLIEISLPTNDVEKYKKLNGSDKLDKVKKAILNLKKSNHIVSISFVITKNNLDDLETVLKLCFWFGVDSISINRFVPSIENHPLAISKDDIKNILDICENKWKKYNLPINITIPIESCIISQDNYSWINFGTCVCGKEKMVIDPIWNLRVCEQSPDILWSLFDSTLEELSNLDSVKKFQNQNLKEECNSCEDYSTCGGGCRFL